MKEEKTEIKKIVIEVEGETVSLSKEGAEKLHKILDELFVKGLWAHANRGIGTREPDSTQGTVMPCVAITTRPRFR